MKSVTAIATMVVCLLLGSGSLVRAQTAHSAHAPHEEHGAAKLSFDHGKKWATDEPLRKAMENLRVVYAENLMAIHEGKLSNAKYKTLGVQTEKEVGNIVAQCKLAPEADAMLHLIIADMIAGADVMTGKTKGNRRAAAHKVMAALDNYGQYFDHPGWKGLW
jgi:hypothetical protein